MGGRARHANAGNAHAIQEPSEREAQCQPIRVGMVGAGATGRAIALQLGTPVPGMTTRSQSLNAYLSSDISDLLEYGRSFLSEAACQSDFSRC